ncbi:MAG: glutaminyl-peptide cyclotransferase [Caldilinea sp.]|nr:glutaminyl-peptide cyclotransferase [Caldilinea sp.]MDW8439265.1 glutaminyl-peptide cyclotransferase [Caldilineaceae bacterium]
MVPIKKRLHTFVFLFLLAACTSPAQPSEEATSPVPTAVLVAPQSTPQPSSGEAFPSPAFAPAGPALDSPLETPAALTPLPSPIIYDYRVKNVFPHDSGAFTQGLVYWNGVFYEGTGLYGRSSLRKVDVKSGSVLQQHDLAPEFFGEGIAVVGDRILQLTWQNGVGFVYDRDSFEELQRFSYATEGWGLTYDGQHLIMSDGTPTIYYLDPETLQEVRRLLITLEGQPLPRLNELEYVEGKILANVWQTDFIVQIDPETGVVEGVYDFTGLLQQAPPFQGGYDVLNGIAYDAENRRLFVTGKLWPYLFEVELIPRQ